MALKLQGDVANAEWACKKGIALTIYGTWYFFGRHIGIADESSWEMRRPYLPLDDTMKKWALETLGVPDATEKQRLWKN
ncbi:uncharacterized protein ColSpa_04839 [Colletotrichum spaethianum]|uniref:Uncharacterized protein n=1 Tax=Colletotrichum spaethianum TaxID=700344 RepID=A0AA37LDZ3_9PEZI|nr:uncharacterized protein ColSpa_04839 [Colletotrichum spaethianum]GKT44658.1 hypothetical protein ColSpa_04839 [Colletotrichum spaethianum]